MMRWAIGDIHGMASNLRALVAKISGLEKVLPDGKVGRLIFTGDYIDRGPEVKQTIDFIMGLGFETVLLAGNHEDMMLRAFHGGPDCLMWRQVWLENGGVETLRSFTGAAGLKSGELAASAAAFTIEKKYRDFFEGLGLVHEEKIGGVNFVFAHAGFAPGSEVSDFVKQGSGKRLNDHISGGAIDDETLWNRKKSPEKFGDYVVVHGHTIVYMMPISGNYDGRSGTPYIRFENTRPAFEYVGNGKVVWNGGASFDRMISIDIDTGAFLETLGHPGFLCAIGISDEGVGKGVIQLLRATKNGEVFHEEIRLVR